MSFSDSNEDKRMKSIGRAFKDFHAFTKNQGKQVCDKVKSTEILSSMKSSKLSQKTFTKMGQVRHQSLEDDGDEEDDHKILLGRSDEDNSSKLTVDRESSKTDDILANAKFGSSSGRGKSLIKTRLPTRLIDNDFEKEDDHFSKSRTPRGIRFPFLK